MNLLDFIKVAPQYLLPQHLLSTWMHAFMQIRISWIKNTQIKLLTKLYGIDLSEAALEEVTDYPTFNDFFTRRLKPGVRPIDFSQNALVSPADGVIVQSQHIHNHTLIQAKCHDYTLEALLGGDMSYAKQFYNGDSAVIYLSPKDYHRVHMPYEGKLLSMTYVPGDLFSVNPATVRQVEGLFARNERLIIRFAGEKGPFCLIMVGAIFVGSMETVWEGKITPPYQPTLQHWEYDEQPTYQKGDEIGRFNMGSTVILLTPENQIPELGMIQNGTAVKMGEKIATFPTSEEAEQLISADSAEVANEFRISEIEE